MIITFNEKEKYLIRQTGSLAREFFEYYGHEENGKVDSPDNWANNHILGQAGEFAVSKLLGKEWQPRLNARKSKADIGDYFEVRQTTYADGHLILTKEDNPRAFYILVTGQLPTFNIVGGQFGYHVKKAYPLEDKGNRGKLAHFCPQSDLIKGLSKEKLLKIEQFCKDGFKV